MDNNFNNTPDIPENGEPLADKDTDMTQNQPTEDVKPEPTIEPLDLVEPMPIEEMSTVSTEPLDVAEPMPIEEEPINVESFAADNTVTTKEPQEKTTVYIDPKPYKTARKEKSKAKKEKIRLEKHKPQRARLGAGSVIVAVLLCVIFSFGAAIGGTYVANKWLFGNTPETTKTQENENSPSVIIQKVDSSDKQTDDTQGSEDVSSAPADNTTIYRGTYSEVAAIVSPTVVEITTESIVTDSYFWGGDYVTSGAGSGVIISADGLIVTNNHVVSGANSIKVTTKDGTSYTAKLIGTDADSDVAVIKIDASDLAFAIIGDIDSLRVGEEVLAVGNPLGNLGGTVTNGIISALSREVTIDGVTMTLIQTNAEVNPGNSGGGLFNMKGELIGIVNAKSTTSSSGVSVEGIGFAIPVNSAINIASELVNYGYVRGKVMLGINFKDITDSWDAVMYGVRALGVYVTGSIHEDFEAGDRIVAVDGNEVTYSSDIKALLKNYKVGDEVVVKVVRKGKYVDVKITLTEYVPANVQQDDTANEEAFENNFER